MKSIALRLRPPEIQTIVTTVRPRATQAATFQSTTGYRSSYKCPEAAFIIN